MSCSNTFKNSVRLTREKTSCRTAIGLHTKSSTSSLWWPILWSIFVISLLTHPIQCTLAVYNRNIRKRAEMPNWEIFQMCSPADSGILQFLRSYVIVNDDPSCSCLLRKSHWQHEIVLGNQDCFELKCSPRGSCNKEGESWLVYKKGCDNTTSYHYTTLEIRGKETSNADQPSITCGVEPLRRRDVPVSNGLSENQFSKNIPISNRVRLDGYVKTGSPLTLSLVDPFVDKRKQFRPNYRLTKHEPYTLLEPSTSLYKHEVDRGCLLNVASGVRILIFRQPYCTRIECVKRGDRCNLSLIKSFYYVVGPADIQVKFRTGSKQCKKTYFIAPVGQKGNVSYTCGKDIAEQVTAPSAKRKLSRRVRATKTSTKGKRPNHKSSRKRKQPKKTARFAKRKRPKHGSWRKRKQSKRISHFAKRKRPKHGSWRKRKQSKRISHFAKRKRPKHGSWRKRKQSKRISHFAKRKRPKHGSWRKRKQSKRISHFAKRKRPKHKSSEKQKQSKKITWITKRKPTKPTPLGKQKQSKKITQSAEEKRTKSKSFRKRKQHNETGLAMTTILTTKITTTALPKADERKNNALTTPSWQVFQSCNSADRTRLEMDKTYIMVYSSGSSTCDCLIEKSRSTKILLGSPDCFEFGCGTSETCDPQTKGWLTHKTSCETRNGCSYTTLRVEGSGNSPEASIRCGVIAYEERPTADEPSAKDFCRSKPTANTVRLLCYPEGAAPKMFTLNRPILPDDYTQNGLGKKYSYSVQYQGPYKLLEPYRPEYEPSDGCGCVVKLVSHVKIEIHSQGDCVRVQCTDPQCELKHDAANDVYTISKRATLNIGYNHLGNCTNTNMTYFLVEVNSERNISYTCGPDTVRIIGKSRGTRTISTDIAAPTSTITLQTTTSTSTITTSTTTSRTTSLSEAVIPEEEEPMYAEKSVEMTNTANKPTTMPSTTSELETDEEEIKDTKRKHRLGKYNFKHINTGPVIVRPPPWQVFQTFNKADHTKLELNKTYIIIHQIQKYSCLIEKSRSTKILLGSPDCFEFGCGTSETCDARTKGWLTHKTSCKIRNGCSYTTLRVEGSGNSPEASIRCGVIAYEERPTADEPSAKNFCRSKPTSNTVRLLCYTKGAVPKMFTLNRPILPDDYTQNGLGKKYSYSVQYQGPYKLLEPYRPEYKPSDGCGCVVKLVSHVKIEIHSQGDCVRVQCTDPLCRLKHDAANDVYTVNSPGSFNVRYNNSRTCTSDRMTYFLAQVNAPGVINYRCGAVGRVRVAKKRPIFKSQALKRKKPKSKLSKIVPGGKPPEAEVFQTCSYLPEAKLTKNKNYALVATKNSCYCLIRKPASDNFVTGSNMCTEVWCKNGKSCINSKEIWINYSPRCSKIDKCGRSLFKIEGSGRSSDASITCGLAKFQSVRTPSSFCQNKQVWHDVVVECYEQKIPVTRLWVASPHSRATPAADTKFIQYNISYQGPYKLLDPYKVGSRVSGSCQCVLDIVGNVDVRVYPGCSCVSVKCAGKNKCKILTTTQGGFIIKGRNEIRVAYKNKAACRKCEQTYFLATGEKGKIAYGCGLGSKVKAHSPTTTTTTTTTLAPTSQADEPKEYSVKPGQPIIPTFHPVQASNVSLPVKSRPTPATRLASMSHIPAKLKWKVFQACNAKDEAKLEINNNYMLIGSDGPACSCVIRKSSHQRLLIGNHDCFKLLCKNETKCLNKEEMWIEFRITCAKKKCAYTTFLVEDTTEATHVNVSVETSIACGLKPLTKIDTKPSDHLCYAGHATHTVLLQCYRNHTPPVEIKTIPPYVGLSPPKAINYLFGYQGPYKLLDPYKKGDDYSTGCSCKINVPKGFNIRVYRGCKCVGVECKQSTKCRISNDAIYHATVINGPADVTVNYTDTKLCSSCDQETYFAVDVGRNGKVTYSCGSAHKVKLPSLTSGIPDIGLPVMGAAAVIGLLLIICVVCVCRKMCKRSRASDRAPLAKR